MMGELQKGLVICSKLSSHALFLSSLRQSVTTQRAVRPLMMDQVSEGRLVHAVIAYFSQVF